MLTSLTIRDLAIIDRLTIDFGSGFNVITGETGAGKSILIKALNLLFGGKAKADVVRKGCETAFVTGSFVLQEDHKAADILNRFEIPIEVDDGEFSLLLRRSVSAKGRSLAWINDVPVAASTLKELAGRLIDVFGQHDNQKLLDAGRHTKYVDSFLSDASLVQAVSASHRRCYTSMTKLREMCDDFRARLNDSDYLTFRFNELDEFGPSAEDYAESKALCDQSHGKVDLQDALGRAQAIVDQGLDGEPLSQAVWQASRILEDLSHRQSGLQGLSEAARAIGKSLDEFSYELGKNLDSLDIDEGAVEKAQERLASYQDFFRKFKVGDIENLIVEYQRLASSLQFLSDAEARVQETLTELRDSLGELESDCKRLSKARLKAAEAIKKRIHAELGDLAMGGARFSVQFESATSTLKPIDLEVFGNRFLDEWGELAERLLHLTEFGQEKAHFYLAANPGEASLPLQNVASGGEVSRIMLALKKALTADAETCVLVFDEIDTGISGDVADKVGRKMRSLADKFQVVSVSHLPQVAVYADRHFLVAKSATKRTTSQIVCLTEDESRKEIARLLSGGEISKASLANADNLRARARKEGGVCQP